MLRSMRELFDYSVRETDDKIGRVRDFLFDINDWKATYLEIDLTEWSPGKKVIIPPSHLGEPDWKKFEVPVSLTRTQVENSPALKLDERVCQRHERDLALHFGWDPCFAGDSNKGESESHLHSSRELLDYTLHTKDGQIGHIEDFLIDDKDWGIRYAVVHTSNWLPGRRVLMAVPWVTGIDWDSSSVTVDLGRDEIENSPEYDPTAPVNRHYEEVLYDYYGRPAYWD